MEPRQSRQAVTAGGMQRRFRGRGLSRRALLLLIPGGALAAGIVTKDSEFKMVVAFLLHFAIHTTWPESAFESPSSPLVVGVAGRDPFGPRLDQMFMGEQVSGRAVEVKRLPAGGTPKGCHLLFVGEMDTARFGSLMKALESEPVLTASTRDGFCAAGGMVSFITEGDRVKFEIHLKAVRARHLEIHSRLLNLAKIYGEGPRR